MRVDTYGQIILNEDDVCEILLEYPEKKFKEILLDTDISLPSVLDIEYPKIRVHTDTDQTLVEFDAIKQNNWFMPNEYKEFDIAKFVLDQCKSEAELQRAGKELLLFQEREMFTLLQYLKYLVDVMRKHNIVWGVGRGSSVASFVLYIIGVHKINSLYYDLSIEEFIK